MKDILERLRDEDQQSLPLIEGAISRYQELKKFIDNRIAALVKLKRSFVSSMPTADATPGTVSRSANLPKGSIKEHILALGKATYPKPITVKAVMLFLKGSSFEEEYGRMPSNASVAATLSHMWKAEELKRLEPGEFLLSEVPKKEGDSGGPSEGA